MESIALIKFCRVSTRQNLSCGAKRRRISPTNYDDESYQMSQISITLPDGSVRSVKSGITAKEIAESIGPRLAKDAIGAKVNGVLWDLHTPIRQDSSVSILTQKDPESLHFLWHSTAHVMAEAVQDLFKNVQVTIGPVVENGFYYDFHRDEPFTPEDLEKIEKRMAEIIEEDKPFSRREVSRIEAEEFFKKKGEMYKVEILHEIPEGEIVSMYTQGEWTDLCRGPHLPRTGLIKAFRLTSLAGAYWRGDPTREMLRRIYGTSWFSQQDLDLYLKRLEEAKLRDHRKLGKELDLFSIREQEVGPGLVFWHPKGAMIRYLLENYWREEHLKRGYQFVYTPTLLRKELWETSGHLENYGELMFFTEREKQSYGIKPMNCIGHIMIYKSGLRSYRDLPIRYFEFGHVHRYEKSGVLHGMLRVRGITQDDAHIFCTMDQLEEEICGVIDFVLFMVKLFGFGYQMALSTRPEKSVGSAEDWELATQALKNALNRKGVEFVVHEGEGAFYGPKIDFDLKDALDRKWQCSTIQVDFNNPERFDLHYSGSDGGRPRPVMVHRAILGSLERFFCILIEHYAGHFPVWLAHVQAIVCPVTNEQDRFAKEVETSLKNSGIRVEADLSNEKLGQKIRKAQLQKIPYMLVIGKKEEDLRVVNPRKRTGEQLTPMSVEEVIRVIQEDVEEKR